MSNLIDLVKTFQERVNQHDIEEIMTMFTEDATFEEVGFPKIKGKQLIKLNFEYHAGVNTNILTDDYFLDSVSANAALNGVPVSMAKAPR